MNLIVGSPVYVAPEIFSQDGYDFKVDIYSLGVVLYQIIAGLIPFEPSEHSDPF